MDNQTKKEPGLPEYIRLIHTKVGQQAAPYNYLAIGKLGLVLYYFSLYEAWGREADADRCIGLLQEVMNEEDMAIPPLHGNGFASGSAGLGYILTLLHQSGLLDIDLQDEFAEMDAVIADSALQQLNEDEQPDFLHGAMGVVHYFLQRANEPVIRQYLEQLAEALCAKAVYTPEGCWFRNYIADKAEKERIDLSLSHGNSGIILLMLKMLEAGIQVPLLQQHITDSIQFILSRRLNSIQAAESGSIFPFYINSIDNRMVYANTRLAWCYGDLNIAWLLYRAAAVLQVPAWKTIADELAIATLSRNDAASTMTSDSHFCHGTSGLAYFYRVIFQHTGNKLFHNAAEFWLGETMRYLGTELKNNYYADKETDLLNGLPGINLVLLSFESPKELAWGRAFLL